MRHLVPAAALFLSAAWPSSSAAFTPSSALALLDTLGQAGPGLAPPKALVSAYIDNIFYAIPAIALLAVARRGRGVHWRQVLGVAALMTPLSLLLLDSFLRPPRVQGFVLWPLPAPHFVLDLVLWFLVWCGAAFFWVPRPARSRA